MHRGPLFLDGLCRDLAGLAFKVFRQIPLGFLVERRDPQTLQRHHADTMILLVVILRLSQLRPVIGWVGGNVIDPGRRTDWNRVAIG